MGEKKFKVGDRVRRIAYQQYDGVPVGTCGVIRSVNGLDNYCVTWEGDKQEEPFFGNSGNCLEIVMNTTPVTRCRRHPTSQRFHDFLKQLGELHDKKMQDYGRATDPFANVRGSQDWGVKPWVGSMVRANDKLKRLQKFASEGKLVNESVMDSFLDLAGYALIAAVLFEDQEKKGVPEGQDH